MFWLVLRRIRRRPFGLKFFLRGGRRNRNHIFVIQPVFCWAERRLGRLIIIIIMQIWLFICIPWTDLKMASIKLRTEIGAVEVFRELNLMDRMCVRHRGN